MGFVRKITGTQAQIDAARANAAATVDATNQAAARQEAQLIQQAKAAADSQAQIAARQAAEAKAASAVSAPLGQADVALDAPSTVSTPVARRKRQASFGTGYSTGVSI